MNNDQLVVINTELQKLKGFIALIIGDGSKPIQEPKEKAAAQENILGLKDLKKRVQDFFKPIKEEAKKPYEEVLKKEKAWIEAIENPLELLDKAISQYNQKERERINAERQAAADEAARKQGEEFAQVVPDTLIVSRTENSTTSESETIEEFKILDHAGLARALMDTGKEHLIYLDKKSETAIKKWLIENPGISAFPGLYFTRGIKNNYRKRA